MKKIGITQRVELIKAYGEKRDCLDQRWFSLVLELNCIPVPLPNIPPNSVPQLLDTLSLDGVILSGGNTLTNVDKASPDAAPERDKFEAELIDECINRYLPIMGVCRGMQMINVHLGGTLSPTENHIAVYHSLIVKEPFSELISDSVNSYHGWGIPLSNLAPALQVVATDEHNQVEAFIHDEKNISGIMWHPEREKPFKEQDINLLRRCLL